MEKEEYKMWIAVRKDLKIPPGKAIVQGCHAVQLLTMKVMKDYKDLFKKYTQSQSVVKACVKADSEEHLFSIEALCRMNNIPSQLICDSGRTVFKEPTFTCIAFGPALRTDLPKELDELKLY